MAKSKSKQIEKLADDMWSIPTYHFDTELAKTEMITMRVTKPMKKDIKIAAHDYGLTVTEYLTQLHRIVTLHRAGRIPKQA